MRSVSPNEAFAEAQAKLASLTLKRIDLNTPEVELEKLIRYEAVHKIHGWRDLRRRLESDCRCYALFDRAHLDEPIIFVEAALVKGMSDRVQPLIDPDAVIYPPETADTALLLDHQMPGGPSGSALRRISDQPSARRNERRASPTEELRDGLARTRLSCVAAPGGQFRRLR